MNDLVTETMATAMLQQTHTLTTMDAVSATGTREVSLVPPRPAKPKDTPIRPLVGTGRYNVPTQFPYHGVADVALHYALVNGKVPETPYEAQKGLVARPHVQATALMPALGADEGELFERLGLPMGRALEAFAALGMRSLTGLEAPEEDGPSDIFPDPNPDLILDKSPRFVWRSDQAKLRLTLALPASVRVRFGKMVARSSETNRFFSFEGKQTLVPEAGCYVNEFVFCKLAGPVSWLGSMTTRTRAEFRRPVYLTDDGANAVLDAIEAVLECEKALHWFYELIQRCPTVGAFDFVTDGYWREAHGFAGPVDWPKNKPIPDDLSEIVKRGVAAGYPAKLRAYADAKPGFYKGWYLDR